MRGFHVELPPQQYHHCFYQNYLTFLDCSQLSRTVTLPKYWTQQNTTEGIKSTARKIQQNVHRNQYTRRFMCAGECTTECMHLILVQVTYLQKKYEKHHFQISLEIKQPGTKTEFVDASCWL